VRYRPEIDGLRAIAVAAVVLFHAGLAPLSGGYVGVDVFFVISGYLIAGLIAEDLAQGRFSLLDFYERRARRLLPALFLVLLLTLPIAWVALLPGAWEDFLRSVIATVFFASNLLFWSQAGYFDTAAGEKPLLHTWSLAVEEQFYLAFPLILLALWRLGPRRTVAALGGLALVSFAAMSGPWAAEAKFYLSPFRAWEFLAGAMCALAPLRARLPLAPAGLVLIAGAALLCDAGTPFPSAFTLLPVCGAVLVVLAPPGDPGSRLLAWKPLVGLGLISYPVYLWHVPLFVFARMSGAPPAAMPALVALSVALGWATWVYVETPFRQRRRLARRLPLFAASASGGLLLAASSLVALLAVPSWLQLAYPGLTQAALATPADRPVCPGFADIGDTVRCRVYGDGPLTVVVWGDSHAKVLEQAPRIPDGATVYILSNRGCPPILGVRRSDRGKNAETCQDPALTETHAAYVESLRPASILLVGRWTVYLNGWVKDGALQSSTHFLTDGRSGTGRELSRRVFVDRMGETIARLARSAPVWVMMQPPDLTGMSPRDRAAGRALSQDERRRWHASEVEAFAGVAAPFRVIETADLFCGPEGCPTVNGLEHLYIDDNHLTPGPVLRLWQRIGERLGLRQPAAGM
jgi:peptidoglycan/LPS O-acetylase OafA/YrhL